MQNNIGKKDTSIRYNRLTLDEINKTINQKGDFEISNHGDIIEAETLSIIKRKGHIEPFSPKKIKRVVMFATEDNEILAEELIRDTQIKMTPKIKIQDLYKQLIRTAVEKISMLRPQFENIAARLQLIEYYKETHDLNKIGIYPPLKNVLKKGIEKKVYDSSILTDYSDEEIEELNKFIIPNRDLLFNYKALKKFFHGYCLNYTKTKKLELPQFAYIRVAMFLIV
jgi:ribonucleoside-diphosphate reductase alpha chain